MGDWVQEVDAPLDTAAYTAGDVMFDAIELEYATMSNGTSVERAQEDISLMFSGKPAGSSMISGGSAGQRSQG